MKPAPKQDAEWFDILAAADRDYEADDNFDPDYEAGRVVLNDENCPPEPQEPEEGDITTEDHKRYFQYGRMILNLGGDVDHIAALREHMDGSQFWPNVWFISDHGNAHLIDMSETVDES